MNTRQNNKLSMLMGVNAFFKEHNTFFSTKPHFVTVITALKNTVDAIFAEAGIVSEDRTGYTEDKKDKRTKVETLSGKVSQAVMAYYTNTGDVSPLEEDDFLQSSLTGCADSNLYVSARQLFAAADPVKAFLAPYNSGPADVAALNTAAEAFLPTIKGSRNKRRERSRSVKKLAELFRAADTQLERADGYMGVFRFSDNSLFTEYKLSRQIIDRASGHTVHKKQGKILAGFVDHAPFAPGILKPATKLALSNSGKAGELVFYFSSRANVRPKTDTKLNTVKNNKTLKTTAAEAGYTVHTPYLNILNPNARPTQWKAEVVK
ncbi:MAG: hypothetical protein AB7G44_07310 [Bacteroidia bacterium]